MPKPYGDEVLSLVKRLLTDSDEDETLAFNGLRETGRNESVRTRTTTQPTRCCEFLLSQL